MSDDVIWTSDLDPPVPLVHGRCYSIAADEAYELRLKQKSEPFVRPPHVKNPKRVEDARRGYMTWVESLHNLAKLPASECSARENEQVYKYRALIAKYDALLPRHRRLVNSWKEREEQEAKRAILAERAAQAEAAERERLTAERMAKEYEHFKLSVEARNRVRAGKTVAQLRSERGVR